MEYLYYVLVIGFLCLLCLLALKRTAASPETAGSSRNRRESGDTDTNRSERELPRRHRAVIARELGRVPTPWGWPGSDLQNTNGISATNGQGRSLRHWVDSLISEKRTIDDDQYRLHRDASLRALLEDRYGRAVEPRSQRYEKVRPPRLRDPSLPYDQQDSFPSGKTDRIMNSLSRQPRQQVVDPQRQGRQPELKEVKTPWGW